MRRALLPIYRVRIPLYYAAAVVLIGDALFRVFDPILVWAALGTAVACVLLAFLLPRSIPTPPTTVVVPPVHGRWQALNSPASTVPSHGIRAYGQTYAIDLVHEPVDTPRPGFGGATMRPSSTYPAFGQPVFAMVDGTVVRASDWRRDHRARSNPWGVIYLMVEGMLRELGGPGFIVGNHVVIRGDDDTYAAVAHLQRGSSTVHAGDRVSAGDRIGRCGNSGNSSEPHVHAQLMDRASLWTAQGIPMGFAGITLGDGPDPVDSLPENQQHMTAGARQQGAPG